MKSVAFMCLLLCGWANAERSVFSIPKTPMLPGDTAEDRVIFAAVAFSGMNDKVSSTEYKQTIYKNTC